MTDCQHGDKLYRAIRHQLKTYRKRFLKQERAHILGHRSVHDRLVVLNGKEQHSDGAVDTVTGNTEGTGAIVIVLERKNRFYLTRKIANKLEREIAHPEIAMLESFSTLVHTIKADNGLEFSDHRRIETERRADI